MNLVTGFSYGVGSCNALHNRYGGKLSFRWPFNRGLPENFQTVYVDHIPRSCNAAAYNVTQFPVRSNVDVWMDEVPTWPVVHLS